MRLAIALEHYSPVCGLSRDVRAIVQELVLRGHQCRLYCQSWEGERIAGADLRPAPVSGFNRHRRSQRFLAWVQADLASEPVDGVIGFTRMPGLDVYFADEPCYLHEALEQHGRLYRRTAHFRHFAECERAVFAPDSATHVLLQAESQRDTYVRHYPIPAQRLHVLPPGIASDRHLPEDAAQRRKALRTQLGLDVQELTLLFVASDFARKGLDRAIATFARLRADQPSIKSRLLVVGQDKPRRFRRLARRLGAASGVEFLGGREDVVDLLLGSDLLVHPARSEAGGRVLLEALVAGLPVVATDVCGYATHVQAGRAGIVLPSPFAQEQLDRAVMRLIDGVFRADCRNSAQLYTRLTDVFSMHSRCAQLIEQLIQQKIGIAGR